jgi:hypothetical protein
MVSNLSFRYLTSEIMDYPKWTGLGGNALDYAFGSMADARGALAKFAQICVAAYQINPQACPFASKSMKASDPASDIVARINATMTRFIQNPTFYNTQISPFHWHLIDFDNSVIGGMSEPSGWYYHANFFLEMEELVSSTPSRVKRTAAAAPSSLNYTSYNWTGPESGTTNDFHPVALMCLDNNFTGISTPASFVSYLEGLISQDDLLGYNVNTFYPATCFTWPNFTNAEDIENYGTTFPSLTGRMLFIAPMYSAGFSLAGVSNTYNFVGSENANILLHNGLGDGFANDPNNCTLNAITNFLSQGMLIQFCLG